MILVGGCYGTWWLSGALFFVSLLALFFAPFFLVPLHLRCQSPRKHSVTLAFVTGLGSWLLSFWCVDSIPVFANGP